jgi:hypothetical protein
MHQVGTIPEDERHQTCRSKGPELLQLLGLLELLF